MPEGQTRRNPWTFLSTNRNARCRGCGKRAMSKPSETCPRREHSESYIRYNAYVAQKETKAREAVLVHYGSKCSCCGETVKEFLTIDHIHGNGREHRKHTKRVALWLVKRNFPEGFRILCMNCNWSVGIWGYCPHKVNKSA